MPLVLRKYKNLVLRPYQVPHYERITNIINHYHNYVDSSPMGCGKSVVTSKVSLDYNLPMIIASTSSGNQPWQREQANYGTNILAIITYQSLRSVKGKQPKHGLLHRIDTRDDDGNEHVSFTPTEYLIQLIDSGILFVMDEVQKIKNNSDQYKACKAITLAILNSGRSRFACLSGSPFDKEEHAVNLLRLMGFIRANRLFVHHKESNDLRLYGAQELIDRCHQINTEATQQTLNDYQLNPRNVTGLCFRLYVDVIKVALETSMPPLNLGITKDVANGYYNMEEEAARELQNAIDDLGRASRYNAADGTVDHRDVDWGALTKALARVEAAKIGIVERVVRRDLETIPNCKVVIFVNYIDSIRRLANAFDEYRPLILSGSVPEKQRPPLVNCFQHDASRRLLVGNLKVGGDSIDLHDIHGNQPRRMYIIPNYSIIDQHQGTGRIYRDGSLSDAYIRFVYGKIGARETSILNALARKKDVLKQILDRQVAAGILFPGEYPEDIEE